MRRCCANGACSKAGLPRISGCGLVAAVLLLAAAPPLMVRLAQDIVPSGQATSLLAGFAWQAIIALAASGLLAVATAPLRAPGDASASPAWGLIATMAALLVGQLLLRIASLLAPCPHCRCAPANVKLLVKRYTSAPDAVPA